MRNNIFHIVKKELTRFFRDKRLVFTTLIMPALLIYLLYSVMGGSLMDTLTIEEDYAPVCYVQNMPDSFQPLMEALGFDITEVSDPTFAKAEVEAQSADLCIIFPDNFDEAFLQAIQGAEAPDIQVYHNSTVVESIYAFTLFTEAAEQFESSVSNVLDINRDVENPDLATSEDITFGSMTSMLPAEIIMLLFAGCMTLTPESIAGEKERGTIATLLVTPVSRTHIAIGKIISLSFIALLSGLSSFVGLALSFPKMQVPGTEAISMDIYGLSEYIGILCVIISTVLLIVSVVSVLSALSKTVKQATSTTTVFFIASTVSGFIPLSSYDFSAIGWKFVPVFNSVLAMNQMFQFDYTASGIAMTCCANLLYAAGFVFLLSKLFNSEKIMFNK